MGDLYSLYKALNPKANICIRYHDEEIKGLVKDITIKKYVKEHKYYKVFDVQFDWEHNLLKISVIKG